MFDTLTHRWLRIPYPLQVRYSRRPKKPRATLLFLHGIGNTGAAWDGIITKMPEDVRIITIDMLGFGDSPSPKWAVYDAKTQARSVLATLIKLRIRTPLVVVGHSMGSLVAIEMAKRYPLLISKMVLCSPPLYDDAESRLPRTDTLLKQLFAAVERHPDRFLRMAAFAMKYKLINDSFNVTKDNFDSYVSTLNALIINQRSLRDAYDLKVPTLIVRGTLDPYVIARPLTKLKKANPNVRVKTIVAGHEVKGLYAKSVVSIIKSELTDKGKSTL